MRQERSRRCHGGASCRTRRSRPGRWPSRRGSTCGTRLPRMRRVRHRHNRPLAGCSTSTIPGLEIGVAAYPDIPTGCTVVNFDVDRFPAGVMLELDARGGATWQSGAYDTVNAISLAGGQSTAWRPPPAWPPSSLRKGDTGIW